MYCVSQENIETFSVIVRHTFIHTGCLFCSQRRRAVAVPVLTLAGWRVTMLFCHSVWTVWGKPCCRGSPCRRPVISCAPATRHNHRCHVCRKGHIREIRRCVCIRERERECVWLCVCHEEEDECSRWRVWECVCHCPSCHFSFMSDTLCLTNKDGPAQHHSWLVSVSHHHYHLTHTHTHSLTCMHTRNPPSLSCTHTNELMARFTHKCEGSFSWPGMRLH